MIHFEKIRWKNFLSTSNNFTEIHLDRQSTTLIVGENGAGKSTILDALCFSLFGKPFRVISKSQLVNTINDREAVVEVEFRIGTHQWKVVRGIKPNKFEIWQDGVMINQEANSRDYQKYLEQNVLRLNFRSFTQVVILGSSTFIPFMQLKAVHRREVVEEILDIKIFSLMNMILKNQLKDLQDDIKDMDYQFEMAIEKIAMQTNYIDDMKKNKDNIITSKQKIFQSNETLLTERENEKALLETASDDLTGEINDKSVVEDKLSKLNNIRATLTEKHKQLTKDMEFFKNNDSCPTCEQDIQQSHKEKMVNKKEAKVKEIVEGAAKLKEELQSVNRRLEEITDITVEIRDNEVKQARLQSSIA